jgi:hypothetical protein
MTADIGPPPALPGHRDSYWLRVHAEQTTDVLRRRIELFDAAGQPLARALVPRRGRSIVVETAVPTVVTPVTIAIRRLFPLTGRVDIVDTQTGARLGGTSRLGVVRRADGRVVGRFRDARTTRSFLGEGVFTVILAFFIGGSDSDAGTSASELRWIVDDRTRGELTRAQWPFGPEQPPVPRAQRTGIARFIPERLSRALRGLADAPTWKLELEAQTSDDGRLTLAAAIFAVELSRW